MSDDIPIRRKTPVGAAGQREMGPRERLRARQQALTARSTRMFVLPGYGADNPELGGELVARYRRMDFDPLREAFRADRWTDDDGKNYDEIAANAQFLADACEDIFIREPDGTITPLVEGHATTFTVNLDSGESLGTILGLDGLPSLREQMVAAFGENELALNDHSGAVHRWMTSMNDADLVRALGEAEAR